VETRNWIRGQDPRLDRLRKVYLESKFPQESLMNLAKHGLPTCLQMPIAASSVSVLERFVGDVKTRRMGSDGGISAVVLQPYHIPIRKDGVPLRDEPQADQIFARPEL